MHYDQDITLVFTPDGVPYPETADGITINARLAVVPSNFANEIANAVIDIGTKYDEIREWRDALAGWEEGIDGSSASAIATILANSADGLAAIQGATSTGLSEISVASNAAITDLVTLADTREAAIEALAGDVSDAAAAAAAAVIAAEAAEASATGASATVSAAVAGAVSDVDAAAAAAVNSVNASITGFGTTVTNAQNTAVSAVTTAQSTAVTAVTTAQSTAVTAVGAAQGTALGAIDTASDDKIATIAATIANFGGVDYRGTWDAHTNIPLLQSSVGTKGHLYRVAAPGNSVLNGFTAWGVGDWALFDGTYWQKVPASTNSGVVYQGEWNALINVPTIASSVGNRGDFYRVAVAGAASINGINSWGIGDWIMFDGVVWRKIPAITALTIVAMTKVVQTPVAPAVGESQMYQKGSNFVIQYNDGGVIRYKWLNLAGIGVTWSYSTVAP